MLYLTAIVVDNINSKIIHLNDDLHQAKRKVNMIVCFISILIFIHVILTWSPDKFLNGSESFPKRFFMSLRAPLSPRTPKPPICQNLLR